MPDLYTHTEINKRTLLWAIVVSVLFIATNLYLIIAKEFLYFSLLPIFLIILYLYFRSIDKVFIITAFLSPLSINLSDFNHNIGLNLPSEPLLAGLLLFYIIYGIYRNRGWYEFRKHPVSIAFYIYFIVLFFSSLTSQIPLVSWKFFVSHLWLILPTFFLGTRIFYEKPKMQNYFIIAQIIPLIIVVLYTLVRHSSYGFADEEGQWVMQPFFQNHAMYGAAISMYIPITFILATNKKKAFIQRFFLFLATILFLIALLISSSRAAWLGFLMSVGLGMVFWFKIKLKYIALSFFVLLTFGLIFSSQIIRSLEKNDQDSSENFSENLKSVSNISTDASNLERLNRWSCAIRMTMDYPFTGTGPGTYQFLYAPYQLSRELTIISTNAGTLGNAHSEFLGPMAESGIPGLLSILFLVGIIFFTGFNTYTKMRKTDPQKARFLLGILLGLVAYFVHGFMNNYLDSDKLAIPVWGFSAIIVAINLIQKEQEKIEN